MVEFDLNPAQADKANAATALNPDGATDRLGNVVGPVDNAEFDSDVSLADERALTRRCS